MIVLDRKIRCYDSSGKLGIMTGNSVNEIGAYKAKVISKIECPVLFCGGKFDVEYIGAFTYIGENAKLRKVKSIGRYVYIGVNTTMGMQMPNYKNAIMSMVFAPYKNAMFDTFSKLNQNPDYLGYIRKKQNLNFPELNSKIEIGNDVYIGDNTTIMSGIKIGNGAYILPGSYVNKNVMPYSIAGGVPCKTLGMRFGKETIEKMEMIQWWKYDPCLMENIDYTELNIFFEEYEKRKSMTNTVEYEYFLFDPLEKSIIRMNTDGISKMLYRGW